MPHPESHGSGLFQATNWTLLGSLNTDCEVQRRQILGDLLVTYLPALKVHLVQRRRMSPENADDLLHDFTVARVLQSELFQKADRTKGRFRSLLVKSLENFARDQFRRSQAEVRSPATRQRNSLRGQPADDRSPEDIARDEMRLAQANGRSRNGFEDWENVQDHLANEDTILSSEADQEWACLVLRQALEMMWQLSQSEGGRRNWNTFANRLLLPLVLGIPELDYSQIVEREGFDHRDQAMNALTSAKRLWHRCLRSVVSKYLSDESEVENDVLELMTALRGHQLDASAILTNELLAVLPDTSQLSDSDHSSRHDLSGLFLIEDHPFENWDNRDSTDLLAEALSMSLSKLIPLRLQPGIPLACLRQTVHAVLHDPHPDLAALTAIKNFGRSWIENKKAAFPTELGAFFYFVSIAVAVTKRNVLITTSKMASIQNGLVKLIPCCERELVCSRLIQSCLATLPVD